MSDIAKPRIHADSEDLVPRVLLRGAMALILAALAIAVIATVTGREPTSKPPKAAVVTERLINITGQLDGSAVVLDAQGSVISTLSAEEGGFVSGLGRVLERTRIKHGVPLQGPVLLRRMENGRIDITDPSTGWSADLMGFGADNARTVARLLD